MLDLPLKMPASPTAQQTTSAPSTCTAPRDMDATMISSSELLQGLLASSGLSEVLHIPVSREALHVWMMHVRQQHGCLAAVPPQSKRLCVAPTGPCADIRPASNVVHAHQGSCGLSGPAANHSCESAVESVAERLHNICLLIMVRLLSSASFAHGAGHASRCTPEPPRHS